MSDAATTTQMRAQSRMFDARSIRVEAMQGEGTDHNFGDGLKVQCQLVEKLTVLTSLHLLRPIAPGHFRTNTHMQAQDSRT
jgi:hypothetical protein